MKTNNKTSRGGEASAYGNNFQKEVTKLLLLSDSQYKFFAQHQNEDVEFILQDSDALLYQMKSKMLDKKEIYTGDVSKWILNYTKNKNWITFFLKNENLIKKWIFIFNKKIINDGSGSTVKISIFKQLKNLPNYLDKNGKIVVEAKIRNDFIKMLRKKILFKIYDFKNRELTFWMSKTDFVSKNKVPNKSLLMLSHYLSMIIDENLRYLINHKTIKYTTFEEFFEKFNSDKIQFSSSEIQRKLMVTSGNMPEWMRNTFIDLTIAYGYIEANVILRNLDKKSFVNKVLKIGITQEKITELRGIKW